MKLRIMSDLHLEFGGLYVPPGEPGEILILAGDVAEADEQLYKFLENIGKSFDHVVYVLGNHEHYNGNLETTYDYIKSHVPKNVHLLENESVVIDGNKFVGTTLWTDFNQCDPETMVLAARQMNDYNYIRIGPDQLTPEDIYLKHKEALVYLERNISKDCIVVTHHAPSKQSIHDRFKDDHIMNGLYVSQLEYLVHEKDIKLWIHGHTHKSMDYKLFDTRIVCNPRGYEGYEVQATLFNPEFNVCV